MISTDSSQVGFEVSKFIFHHISLLHSVQIVENEEKYLQNTF